MPSAYTYIHRVFVCVMVVFSILWIPIVQSMHGAQLYIYIQVRCAGGEEEKENDIIFQNYY